MDDRFTKHNTRSSTFYFCSFIYAIFKFRIAIKNIS